MRARRLLNWRTAAPLALATALIGTVLVTGCATPADALPDGIRVELVQNRADQAVRRLQLRVVNEGEQAITVSRAVLSSPRLAEDVVWTGDTTVPAGSARDLRLTLPAANCAAAGEGTANEAPTGDGTAREGAAEVARLTVTSESGTATSGFITPTDPIDSFAQFAERDCFERAVAERVDITLADAIRSETQDAALIGQLDMTLTAVGDAGQSARVTHVLGTTLLEPLGDPQQWPLDELVAAGSPPRTIQLQFLPARCDPHAVAEDKRGSLLPIGVELETGESGTVWVPTSDAVRLQIYDYIGAACGWPASTG
ncbi:hypothetical protein [Salinibacterium sp. ZJ450]|uniref:hypothetical protein n=1 Tax=Salinibacterium sp. ZJ450 TaxID=2708338 RepID=UPI001420B0F8|nr:hypothetical protein [Salinibacterium sp. ZJ450]